MVESPRPRRRVPPKAEDSPSGVAGKSPAVLLGMAIALGPIVYVYTKQWGRLAVFSILLVVAFFASFALSFAHYVREEDLAALTAEQPGDTAWLLGKITAWVLLAVGAVLVACVADVWWQQRQAARGD